MSKCVFPYSESVSIRILDSCKFPKLHVNKWRTKVAYPQNARPQFRKFSEGALKNDLNTTFRRYTDGCGAGMPNSDCNQLAVPDGHRDEHINSPHIQLGRTSISVGRSNPRHRGPSSAGIYRPGRRNGPWWADSPDRHKSPGRMPRCPRRSGHRASFSAFSWPDSA